MTSPASEHILALDGIAVIVNRNNPKKSASRVVVTKIAVNSVHLLKSNITGISQKTSN